MTTMEKRYKHSQFVHAKMLFYKMWAESFMKDGLSIEETAKTLGHSTNYIQRCLITEDKEESKEVWYTHRRVKYNGLYPVEKEDQNDDVGEEKVSFRVCQSP